MNASELLGWQYLIFLLPMAISALLLLLSSLKLGHRGGHGGHGHAGHAHGGHASSAGHRGHEAIRAPAHSPAHAPPSHHSSASGHKTKAAEAQERPNVTINNHFVWNLTGSRNAPLPMVLEAFFLVWGLCGYWANRMWIHGEGLPPAKILPSVAAALVGGLIGARLAAEVLGRMMPEDESLVVSREGLYGLIGKVAFPVSETSGRIHVYDSFGTLHDEMCRVEAGRPTISRGGRAMVVDRDTGGRLIVEAVE